MEGLHTMGQQYILERVVTCPIDTLVLEYLRKNSEKCKTPLCLHFSEFNPL